MANINIENIVVSTQIAKSLDLDKLGESLPESKYDPKEIPTLVIHFEKPKTAIMLFSDGKVVFTGPKNMEEVDEIIKILYDKLSAVGVKTYRKPDTSIQNIVASTDLKKNLDLTKIAALIGNVEYEPEKFLGLIYKTDDPNTVILIFDSGKIVCNGIKLEEISIAIDKLTNELSSLEIL